MRAIHRLFVISCLITVVISGPITRAQPVLPGAANTGIGAAGVNKKLRMQIDRPKIRAFEPLYLCITAEQFATGNDPEVFLSHGSGTPTKLDLPAKSWIKAQLQVGNKSIQRRGVALQSTEHNGARTWLFETPGDYNLLVKVGNDSTTLTVNVLPPEPGEADAWQSVADRVDDLLQNNFDDQPSQATIDACARVVRRFPKTACSGYALSYISITKFKVIYDTKGKRGGKAYTDVSDELAKSAKGFQDNFFGEMMTFYAAYSKGLTGDYEGVIAVTNGMNTHFTQWGDAVTDMRSEVLSHIAPHIVLVDPAHPTTNPTSAPVMIPVPRP